MDIQKASSHEKVSYLLGMAAAEFSLREQSALLATCQEFVDLDAEDQQNTIFLINKNFDSDHVAGATHYPPAEPQHIQPDLVNFLNQLSATGDEAKRDSVLAYMISRFEIEKDYLKTVVRESAHTRHGPT